MWDRYKPALVFLLVGFLLYLGYVLRREILLIYVSVLIAVLLTPIVEWVCRLRVRRWRPSRGAGAVILAGLLLGMVVLFGTVAAPPILRDTRQLEKEWPARGAQLMNWVHQHLPFAQHLTLARVDDAIKQAAGGSLALKRVGNGVIAFLTMLLVAFYFIIDGTRAFDWFVSLFPKTRQARIRRTFSRGGRRMQRWLAGQGLLMLAHGGSAMIVFGAIHLRYFYILGIFAGIINIIPVLGPIITLVVAGLVASIDSLTKLIAVIIFYLVYHSVENAFLNPRIMESKVKIPAVTVVTALVIGDGLAGIVGILISVPTAVLVSVVIDEYLASDQPDQSTVPRRAA